MNIRKLTVKTVYGLDAALIIVLIGLLLYQQRLIRQMSINEQQIPPATAISGSNTLAGNNTQTNPIATSSLAMDEGGVEQLAAEVELLRYQLEASEEELEMAREDLGNENYPDEDWQEAIAIEKKARGNPILMEAKRRRTENEIVKNTGLFELFKKLGLQDETIQALKALLVDNQMEMDFLRMCSLDRSMTDEDRKELQQQFEDQDAGFEIQMRKLMGTENYEKYNHYEETWVERSFGDGTDLGLSDEKSQELIDAMYEARKEVEAKYDGFEAGYHLNDVEQIDREIEVRDAYMESARRVLSESQARKFETKINESKEMLKLSRWAHGGGGDKS